MILATIMFDSNSKEWTDNRDHTHMFLLCAERHINDTIRFGGYIYLNQIYEHLGIKWNPDDNNPCIKNDGVNRIAFIQFEVFDKPDNSICIVVHRYE